MKLVHCLATLGVLQLGCGATTPNPAAPAPVLASQRPTDVTVVSLSPPADPEPAPVIAAVPAPPASGGKEQEAQSAGVSTFGNLARGDGSGGWDPEADRGAMLGASVGDSFGAGGLGLTGTGVGAGGVGTGIGLGQLGGFGHGTRAGAAPGSGSGGPGGSAGAAGPQIRMGALSVTGKLLREVIQRILRLNHGRFRVCYEHGLRTNPTLAGDVAARFVIEKDGSVAGASLAQGTNVADKQVASCVTGVFSTLSFPAPEDGGKVSVDCTIKLSPGQALPATPPAVKVPPAPPASAGNPALSPPAAPAKPASAPAPGTP